MTTKYHTKYFTYELTRKHPSDDSDKLTSVLVDAQIDMNPHQIDAALFAFQSPLSKGAILADEVGLGKTIEAGLVISQKWAERKRKLLILVPSSLRKQWSQELMDKFFIPSIILETKNFNKFVKAGKYNPFDQKKVIICSYQFARNKDAFMKLVDWDMIVIDEAHRLRNVYRTDNKIGKAIREALQDKPKILMTATPLQNTLLELYGLVSFIDDHTFGELKSFKSQFSRVTDNGSYEDLKSRLAPICKRTLRNQVREYVPYTDRTAITIDFVPSDDEQDLYKYVTNYLQRELLYALPAGQRHLMTLILRKLLASSTFAIAGTLNSLMNKLKKVIKEAKKNIEEEEEISKDYELYSDLKDEWNEDEENNEDDNTLTEEEIEQIEKEIAELEYYRDLATTIKHNEKGKKLIPAIEQGFAKSRELGANEKAIIFTESTRTQNYLYELLQETDYKDKIVLFNGSNNDLKSKQIYKHWISKYDGTDKVSGSRTADMRAAIVDYFRDDAKIMIATEAAAEGINLQFCNILVNYDLPWNPQRIEQRIGRCHRYGQKFDVVVVNFLNKKNAADVRVYQLLDEKFKLFNGVFGASDEILGTIESGVDFEKRIAEIYQTCRNEKEIQSSFDKLQVELEEQINNRMSTTREKLLENFDIEVTEKLKLRLDQSKENLKKYEELLWRIVSQYLKDYADINDDNYTLILKQNPFPKEKISLGKYKLGRKIEDAHIIRPGSKLVECIFKEIRELNLPGAYMKFDLSGSKQKIAILEELKGKSGYLTIKNLEVNSFETTDHLLFAGVTSDNKPLLDDQCKRLFNLGIVEVKQINEDFSDKLEKVIKVKTDSLFNIIKEKNNEYFLREVDKLSKWADDQILAAENEIKETKMKIKELNRESKKVTNPDQQLKIQKELQELNKKQRKQRQKIFEVEDSIQEQRELMISEIENRMKQRIKETKLFTIEWEIE